MKTKKNNLTTLEQFKDKHYGKRGTAKRDRLEAGYKYFKTGALIHEARIKKNLHMKILLKKLELKNPGKYD